MANTRKKKAAQEGFILAGDSLDISTLRDHVHKLLKFSSFEPEQTYWLDTGSKDLNGALGSPTLGLPYGKLFEIAGHKHGGKTALVTVLAGLAQRDGAVIGYMDLENSYDPAWAAKLGLDPAQVYLITPRLMKVGSDIALQSAEQMFDEAQAVMKALWKNGTKKQFWILDSVANLQTQLSIDTTSADRNMRTNVDRALFLSSALPKWAGYAANYSAMVMLINQLRTKPGIAFGDPFYTPGGNTIPFVASVQARVTRIKNGKLVNNGKTVGIVGKIVNNKNKAGEGSVQDQTCAFKIQWNKDPAKVEFMTIDQAEKVLKGED